jgi:hypothetical protein
MNFRGVFVLVFALKKCKSNLLKLEHFKIAAGFWV